MALSTITRVRALLPSGSDADDEALTQLLDAADAAVKTYLQRGRGRSVFPSWPESGSGTEFLTGSGTRHLRLTFTPVSSVTSVYEDPTGYYGDGSNAFASTTLLTAGTDFVLRRDDGTQSASGILVRLAGASDYGWWPPGRDGWGGGGLAYRRGPVWPKFDGGLKVTYVAGFSTVPEDLKHAVDQVAIWMFTTDPTGGPLQSESMGQYSYTRAVEALSGTGGGGPVLGSARATLNRYREIPL